MEASIFALEAMTMERNAPEFFSHVLFCVIVQDFAKQGFSCPHHSIAGNSNFLMLPKQFSTGFID